MTSEVHLSITVTDENDNPPEFEQTTYWSSVGEDAVPGQYVTTVRASSRDTGVNAQISYTIQAGNDKDRFTVEEETGETALQQLGNYVHQLLGKFNYRNNLPS